MRRKQKTQLNLYFSQFDRHGDAVHPRLAEAQLGHDFGQVDKHLHLLD